MTNKILQQDIKCLHEEHGISPLLTQSLTDNPKDARECIRFFKQIMYLFNGSLIALGFVFVWYGLTNYTTVGYVLIFIGVILAIRFVMVLIGQMNAVQAMEDVANKHNLI